MQSRKLRYTFEKLLVYLLLIICCAFFESYFFPLAVAGYTITKLLACLLVFTELKSIAENAAVILNSKIIERFTKIFTKKVEDKIGIKLEQNDTDSTKYTEFDPEKETK